MAKAALEVEGGTAPPPAGDADQEQPLGPEAPPPLGQPPVDEAPAEWTRDTVRTIVALPFMAAHLFARRRGPADAWMPDEDELDLMVGPLLNMANRYTVTRAFARFGDPVAFAAAVGTYTTAESRRVALWRLEHAQPGEATPSPDEELHGLHVAADGPQAPVRPWRPPVVEDA